MRKVSEQFNNFLGGVTSELRADYNIPKFARLWNFDVSEDRAIQHYGLKDLLSEPNSHIIEYISTEIGVVDQVWTHSLGHIVITGDCDYVEFDGTCDNNMVTSNSMNGGTLNNATVPIYYNGSIMYQLDDKTFWYYDIAANNSTQILQDLDPNNVSLNSFFLEALNNKVYIFTGGSVHSFELPDTDGNYISGNDLEQYQPITEYMQEGDRNGYTGTYVGFLGPETQTISQVDELQSILSILQYYSGPIDGIYGQLTKDAVAEFQSEFESSGQYQSVGGQAPGVPLVVDGIVGPETQSVLNAVDEYDLSTYRERYNLFSLGSDITAVCNYGGYITIATHDADGDARVYFWDKTLDSKGSGYIGLMTDVTVGKGIVQILKPVDGRLIAIMSPSTFSMCSHKYGSLDVYGIEAGFDMLPQSKAVLLNQYRLRNEENNSLLGSYNRINQKSIMKAGRLYFSGQIHLQTSVDANYPGYTGMFAGVMSMDRNGNLFTEVSQYDSVTNDNINSFGLIELGFMISSGDGVRVQSKDAVDNISGLITKIINSGKPWENKHLDNIFLSLHNTSELDDIEIYIREIEDINGVDAGWKLAYKGLTTENKFNQRVVINRMEDGQRFADFREIQVMVKLFGKCSELTDLTVNYSINDTNE